MNGFPLEHPLVEIYTFEKWKDMYNGPQHAGQLERLVALQSSQSRDPIAYILLLSKIEHKSDATIAQELGGTWTAKVIFTLRKQCGIVGNDHRQASREKLMARPKQATPVQNIVKEYGNKISSITAIQANSNLEELLVALATGLGFDSIDALFKALVQEGLGVSPIKQIFDNWYNRCQVPSGKGKGRVGCVYIRQKIKSLSALL